MPKKKKEVEEVLDDKVTESAEKMQKALEDLSASFDEVKSALVAYADFEVNGVQYVAGDVFTPPAGWTRDAKYDEFRGIQVKNKAGKEIGAAFSTPSGLQIVPVKEA